MAAKTATSKVSPVVTGSGEEKSTSFIATKVTGPDNNGAYSSEIIQYDNAKGEGGKTIGTRDPNTGVVTLNDNASADIKANKSSFKKASDGQIDSLQDDLATSASEKEKLNRVSGKGNQDNTNGNTDSSTSKATPRNESDNFGGMPVVTGNPRNSYEQGLCYPVAMRSNLKDNIHIVVRKHQAKKFKGLTTVAKPKGPTIGSVILPMPSAIGDGNKTEWGSGTMTPAQMAASGAVKKLLGKEGAQGAVDEAQKSLEGFVGGGGDTALKNFFTEQLTGASDLLARTEGMVMNPNMENLFKGPSLRSFSFSWKMSPRDQAESVQIMKIVRMFKQSMAPQKVAENLFLKAPNIYKLQFNKGSKKHKYLPKMKTCVLIDFGMNYTPDGSYMTYQNSSMVSYEMSMSFQEIEPVFNNDMSHTDDSIGY